MARLKSCPFKAKAVPWNIRFLLLSQVWQWTSLELSVHTPFIKAKLLFMRGAIGRIYIARVSLDIERNRIDFPITEVDCRALFQFRNPKNEDIFLIWC